MYVRPAVLIFSVFPQWLPHHVTYDVIIIIRTFHMSSSTNDENVVSIWQEVAEKNMKVLCGQTDRQTNKQEEDIVQNMIRAKSIKQI